MCIAILTHVYHFMVYDVLSYPLMKVKYYMQMNEFISTSICWVILLVETNGARQFSGYGKYYYIGPVPCSSMYNVNRKMVVSSLENLPK